MLSESDLKRPGLLLVTVLSCLAVALIYILTLSRSVGWHDSAELAITAFLPGASHAPGSPLHALLGNLFAAVFSEAHIGTTVLSAVMAVLSVGVLAALLYAITGAPFAAVLGAVAYGLSFQVWANAVITELYSLGAACLGLALVAVVWASVQATAARCGAVLLFYCLALAAYFGNIILWPVFAWFFWQVAGMRGLILYGVFTAASVALIGAANAGLAAHALPFGSVRPDSLASVFLYMSGAQHEPLQIRTVTEWSGRFLEHSEIFLRSTGYVAVVPAAFGLRFLQQRAATFGIVTAGVFLFYMGYYTFFGSGDYYLMVVPAYFIFYLWVGCGLAWLLRRFNFPAVAYPVAGLVIIYVAVLLLWQLPGRRAMAQDRTAERFAATALEHLPADALVVLGYRNLTTLTYFQAVEGQRPDLTLILPARDQRYYLHGDVADYQAAVGALPCERAALTNKALDDWPAVQPAGGALGEDGWYRLLREGCSQAE